MKRFKSFAEDVSQKQLNDLEKFADRLLAKFGVDVEFTRHFADRMNDARNKPAVTVAELQRIFKKIAKNKAKNIRQNPDSEAVIKDMQTDLNLPIVINYDKNKDEFEVVNKTIMRKKNFGTSDKVFAMESVDAEKEYGASFVASAKSVGVQRKLVKELGANLKKVAKSLGHDGGGSGLTPDNVKSDSKWKAAKKALDVAFKKEQNMNKAMSKAFGKEMRDFRNKDRKQYMDMFR